MLEIHLFRHYLYEYQYKDKIVARNRLTAYLVDEENASKVERSPALKKMMNEQPNKLIGYGFTDSHGNTVGHVYIMFRGGNEIRFLIRNIDTYIFAVEVFEKYQGNGYASEMINMVIEEMHNTMNASLFYLTVDKRNKKAIHIYEKFSTIH